ncbi:MAG: two-component regulator propeller domain-containing protein [Mangrovibacterium sp.]
MATHSEQVDFIHYTTDDGLPSPYVKNIAQDADGFLWVATRDALARFDGVEFREFPCLDKDHQQVMEYFNQLFLYQDSILVARTNDNRFYCYDSNVESFRFYPLLSNLGPTNNIIPSDRGYWVCQNNELFFLDAVTAQQIPLRDKLDNYQIPDNIPVIDVLEQQGFLVFMSSLGKVYFLGEDKLTTIDLLKLLPFDSFDIRLVDSEGNLWLNSNDYGIVRINPQNLDVNLFPQGSGNGSIPHSFVHRIIEDKQKRVWIGTEGGLAVYDMQNGKMAIYTSNIDDPYGLSSNPIYDIFCDDDDGIWLGTYFSGMSYYNGKDGFFRKWNTGHNRFRLRAKVVSCFEEGENDILWVGSEDNGLNQINLRSGEVNAYTHDDNEGNSITYNNLHDLKLIDDKLWIATYTGGVSVMDVALRKFSHYSMNNTNGQLSNVNYQFLHVGDSLFIAGSEGVVIHNLKTKHFQKLKPKMISHLQFESLAQAGHVIWLASARQIFTYDIRTDSLVLFDEIPSLRTINFVKADSRNNVWIGTCYDGLYEYNYSTHALTHYDEENGFPANWIFSLEEGEDHQVWVSTNKGLVLLDNSSHKSTLFDKSSDIQVSQFNFRASYKDSNSNIYFGGYDGMISFRGKYECSEDISDKAIAFTEFRLFGKQITPCEDGLLQNSINAIESLELNYSQNAFSIHFSALNFQKEGRCKYTYRLDGNDQTWSTPSEQNFANYTNLNHGKYKFQVRVLNEDNRVIGERCIPIRIRPPFWFTVWAYLIYAGAVILIFILVFSFGKKLEKVKTQAKLEHQEKIHAEKLNHAKLEFFTNISHEIKTPLTLIFSPLQKLMANKELTPSVHKQLKGVEKNAKRLYNLVNQLLEFRKIELGKEKLSISKYPISYLVNDVAASFTSAAEDKEILFTTEIVNEDIEVWVDAEKLDKIIFNLLSNAFKYTAQGGEVNLQVSVSGKRNGKLIIKVTDTGIGIEKGVQNQIFERFYQIDNQMAMSGSGIGLAYTKSLVELHKGAIRVESEVDKGSRFQVILPVAEDFYAEHEKLTQKQFEAQPKREQHLFEQDSIQTIQQDKTENITSKRSLLVVEDNVEIVNLLKVIFEDDYAVSVAFNGEEALSLFQKANFMPDIIISDIMMPKMDGIEFTRCIKNNIQTSHIPVVILTSKEGEESQLEGMLSGADTYFKKPFFPEVLKRNIDNIISTRHALLSQLVKDSDELRMVESNFSVTDMQFVEKLNEVISKHLTNPDLDVTLLIQELGVSRSLLHLKLKKMMNCSTTEYIRITRLKKAVKLIASGKCNISEAAYETGFSSPTYFTRRFKEIYGKTPTEYFQ